MLHLIHGGPYGAFNDGWQWRWHAQSFAARGYLVAMVNFHGSSGFGKTFADSITGDVGTMPMIDIMRATDWFSEQPWIDKSRIAAADPRLAFIGEQFGMFSMLPLEFDQVQKLRSEHGIYMADSGRFNVLGMADHALDRFIAAIIEAMNGRG